MIVKIAANIYVNPDHVVMFRPTADRPAETTIFLRDGKTLIVRANHKTVYEKLTGRSQT